MNKKRLFLNSQCFQSDISLANIAPRKIHGNFLCWAGSFVIDWPDSSVLGVVCFAHLWKPGMCLQPLEISLLELTRTCGLDLDCLRIAILSLAHMTQFLVANVLTALIGLSCQMMLQVIPLCWLNGDRLVSWNWVAKCLECESDFSPSLTSFWTSLKCFCILALNFVVCFPCVLFLCCWIWLCRLLLNFFAHVVAATCTISSGSAAAWQSFKVLGG